jgi:hypothetical protein
MLFPMACPVLCLAANQPPNAPADVFSPFGIGSDSQTGRNLTSWLPQMAEIGIPWIRTCTAGQMEYVADHHMQFGGLLFGTPPDDKLDARGTMPVKDLAAWSSFVTQRVNDAHGRVEYWEVWNEPPNFIGKGQTAADYARLVVATYDAAHAVDPSCKVGLAAKSVHINWLEQAIKAGAKDHFDYIVLHPYEVLGVVSTHAGTEPVYLNIVSDVRKMLTVQQPDKVNCPIIFTELGCDTSQGEDHQAHALVKAYTMGIAQGVDCIQWFEGIDGDSGPMGLLRRDGKPRPAYTAMGQMIKHLGLHPTFEGWVLLNDKDYGFLFQDTRQQGDVLITWAPVGETDTIRFKRKVAVVNALTGNSVDDDHLELTDAPVIILNPPEDLVAHARSNRDKPYLWDGDYTNARSISVTFGQSNIEKGLHTMSAKSVAQDVIAYGGAARAGGVPGGNVFMVDPNFLSYTSIPIEISITVRRNPANDNAGFKLNYESIAGSKNCGWFTVPDNKRWHTVTYKITDEQFVSMYGFNFSLDSDGNQYNKYDIQNVTVTKLDH